MGKNGRSRLASPTLSIVRYAVLSLLAAMLILAGALAWPAMIARFQSGGVSGSPASPSPTLLTTLLTRLPSATSTDTPTPSATPLMLLSPTPAASLPDFSQGLVVLSVGEGGYSHLVAYQPSGMPFVRLTDGPWDDVAPALSPDGSQLAFASNRDGFWDLYKMDLTTGVITRLTVTPEYEGAPAWSPDGLWLAYESYVGSTDGGNLDILIRPLDGSKEPINLTNDPAMDASPAWAPGGRQVAFVSTRGGEQDIWLADLDRVDDRYHNISRSRTEIESHPTWSPDGSRLAWSSETADGMHQLLLWDSARPDDPPEPLGAGVWTAWSPDNDMLLASLPTPNEDYLTGYSTGQKGLALPLISLSGGLDGLTWGMATLPNPLPSALNAAAQVSPTPIWMPVIVPGQDVPNNRYRVVPLEGIQAPFALMSDAVDESFYAFRQRITEEAGWDFLSSLEEAFIPLTSPPDPGQNDDWLYTGRAFRFNTAPINAGWIVTVREDYGPQTYWRIFVRTRFQDGTQGRPLDVQPWNLAARHESPLAYEQGGALEAVVPSGYWLDFTRLASAYGWERQPALSPWKMSFSAARVNELALRSGLDWFAAMLQIYPRSALDTPTPVSSPTATSTFTNTPTMTATVTRTPYRSPTPTATWTRRPTRTPTPTFTRRPTRTPTVTPTPRPTRTPTPAPP